MLLTSVWFSFLSKVCLKEANKLTARYKREVFFSELNQISLPYPTVRSKKYLRFVSKEFSTDLATNLEASSSTNGRISDFISPRAHSAWMDESK